MVKSGASEEYVYSEDQQRKLFSACVELRDKILIGLMSYCGLRVGEAIHLKLDWIREGEIHIPSSMKCNCWECRKRGHWEPKSKMGVRTVAIPEFLKPLLVEFLKYQPEGLNTTRQAAYYRVRQVMAKAKLPITFPHALRATCATILASKGFTGAELCQFFGWKRLEMGEHYIRIAVAKAGARKKMKEIYG